jgi:hypothetical protein
MAIPRNLANLAPKLSATGGSFATTIGVGAATPAASGAGITFPASVSASSDPNTLDDYEEGTFSPIYEPETGSFTAQTVYGFTEGTYTRIGNICYISIQIANNLMTKGTASGGLFISGLPFNASTQNWITGISVTPNTWAGEKPFIVNVLTTGLRISLWYKATSDGVGVQNVVSDLNDTTNGNYFQCSGVYRVA